MSISDSAVKSAQYVGGRIVIRMISGVELSFPVAENPRLCKGSPEHGGMAAVCEGGNG